MLKGNHLIHFLSQAHPLQTVTQRKCPTFSILGADTVQLVWSHAKKSPNWIHVLCITSFFNNEYPYITVSQNAYGNRKLLHLWCLKRTPVALSLWGGNCIASLFVRFFTSLLMSTQIKMTILSEGSEAQSPPTYSISWERKMQCEQNPMRMVAWACACAYMRTFLRAVNLKWFLEWEDNLEVETSTLTFQPWFPTVIDYRVRI